MAALEWEDYKVNADFAYSGDPEDLSRGWVEATVNAGSRLVFCFPREAYPVVSGEINIL